MRIYLAAGTALYQGDAHALDKILVILLLETSISQ
jgi:hypothetical protein